MLNSNLEALRYAQYAQGGTPGDAAASLAASVYKQFPWLTTLMPHVALAGYQQAQAPTANAPARQPSAVAPQMNPDWFRDAIGMGPGAPVVSSHPAIVNLATGVASSPKTQPAQTQTLRGPDRRPGAIYPPGIPHVKVDSNVPKPTAGYLNGSQGPWTPPRYVGEWVRGLGGQIFQHSAPISTDVVSHDVPSGESAMLGVVPELVTDAGHIAGHIGYGIGKRIGQALGDATPSEEPEWPKSWPEWISPDPTSRTPAGQVTEGIARGLSQFGNVPGAVLQGIAIANDPIEGAKQTIGGIGDLARTLANPNASLRDRAEAGTNLGGIAYGAGSFANSVARSVPGLLPSASVRSVRGPDGNLYDVHPGGTVVGYEPTPDGLSLQPKVIRGPRGDGQSLPGTQPGVGVAREGLGQIGSQNGGVSGQEYLDAVRRMGGRLAANPFFDPEHWRDAATVGRYLAESGFRDFSAWAKRFRQEVGGKWDDVALRQLYDHSAELAKQTDFGGVGFAPDRSLTPELAVQGVVHNALEDLSSKRGVIFARIGQDVSKDLEDELGFNIRGFGVNLSPDYVRHIIGEHGDIQKELAVGNVAVAPSDFTNLIRLVGEPDRVSVGRDRRDPTRPAILFEKQLGDGHFSIQNVFQGKKQISVTNYFKRPAGVKFGGNLEHFEPGIGQLSTGGAVQPGKSPAPPYYPAGAVRPEQMADAAERLRNQTAPKKKPGPG